MCSVNKYNCCDLDSVSFSYVLTEYMQSDLHKIIVSQQPLSSDHIKVFTYQILRGKSALYAVILKLYACLKHSFLTQLFITSLIYNALFSFFLFVNKTL